MKDMTNQVYGMKALLNRIAVLEAAVLQLQHLAWDEDASGDLMPQQKTVTPEPDPEEQEEE